MNLRRIDLNLLPVLHVLLEEAHVSRAALRLGLSQPATSSALERCRHVFGDPLLERVGGAMRLTAKGRALRDPIAEAMAGLGALFETGPPALAELCQPVHVVMADSLAAWLAPALYAAVQARAPGLALVLHPWGGGTAAIEGLARGTADLVISVLPPAMGGDIAVEAVREVRYTIAMRRDHPAVADFDLDRWLAWPHVVVSAEGRTRTPVDDALALLGRARRVGMVVPSFLLVPAILRRSDLVALLPAVALAAGEAGDLATCEPPLDLDAFALHLAWHRRRSGDPAVQFIADRIRELLAQRPAP